METCKTCGGSGEIKFAQNTMFGKVVNVRPCDDCHGEGKVIKEPCPTCLGRASLRKNKKITIDIPAGVDTGSIMPLRGEGDAGPKGGPKGDLYIYLRVKPHNLFKRNGTELYCEIPISFVQAALGDEIGVTTLDGEIKYTVPEGTQTGTTFKIKGKGIPSLRNKQRGDLYFTVKVNVPKKLTEQQKDILKKFAEAGGEGTDNSKSFFNKMKGAFGR